MIKVSVALQYAETLPNGTERKIPLPDNYPDQVDVEIQSMAQLGAVVAIAVQSDLEQHGIAPPKGLVFYYTEIDRARN